MEKGTRFIQGEVAVRQHVASALKDFSHTVGSTAGPHGRLVAIRKGGGAPHLTKDGVTVAQAFKREGFEGVAVDIVRQSAIETGRKAGDGTTTATTLAVALYEATETEFGEVDERVLQALEKAPEIVEGVVDSMRIPVASREQLYGVAYTSSNGDDLIAGPVTEAFDKLGARGAVTVEEDRSRTDIGIEWIEGATFPAGFASPYFAMDGTSRVTMNKPLIWFSLSSLDKPEHVSSAMHYAAANRRPLLIVCEAIGDEALAVLLTNVTRGAIEACAVNSPYLGNMRVTALRDFATVCGAKPTTRDIINDKNIGAFLGGAERAVIEPKLTSIFSPHGDEGEVANLAQTLETELAKNLEENERNHIQARLGNLRGAAAIIKVGGSTHAELVERKDRADDAVASARWALLEGILPGAGLALMACSKVLSLESKEVSNAFLTPFAQVYANSFNVSMDVALQEVQKLSSENFTLSDSGLCRLSETYTGLDLRTKERTDDLVSSGVIDSAYAVKEAIRSALSSAIALSKLRAIILSDEQA